MSDDKIIELAATIGWYACWCCVWIALGMAAKESVSTK